MLAIYRFTSNQEAMKEAKDQIKRYFLEVRLYKDDFGITFEAIKKILRINLTYMRLSLLPAVVLIVLIVFIMIQLNLRFGYNPLKIGDRAIVAIQLSDGISLEDVNLSIEAPEGIEVETPPLRLFEEKEVDWRIRASQTGSYELGILISGERFTKAVLVGDGGERLSPHRARKNTFEGFLYPGEPFLPKDSLVKSISIKYPERSFKLWGWDTNWIVLFFGFSMVSGLVFKRLFKVA